MNGQNIYTFDLEDDLGNQFIPNGLIEAIFIMAPCVFQQPPEALLSK
ncbi:MAG: hypothetical protein IPP34_18695 [Bacteroidetes bacterium]|nr:hypothetical protein [Bacteroidota bacterium]